MEGALDVCSVLDAIATDRPDAEAIVHRDRRLTRADVADRTNRLAAHLAGRGLGCHTGRATLAGHESGQDHLGIYLLNSVEYLESMIGAWKARVAPFNVNYRYVAEELRYVLEDAGTRAIVVHSCFAPTLAEVLPVLPAVEVIIQVPDHSGNALLPSAVWYDDAVGGSSARPLDVGRSPDDLYILYTGGTTGLPKGVLWRNGDAMVECFGGSRTATDLGAFVAEANAGFRALIAPPFMHGAGHWVALSVWLGGGTVFVLPHPEHLDPREVWRTVEVEGIDFLLIVGDAFARPLLDELGRGDYDTSSLNVLMSGGAALSVGCKSELLERLPTLMVVDGMGSSEAGGQLAHVSTGSDAATGTFPARPGTHVLSADLSRVLAPGDDELGWLAKSGRLALGYLGDAEKTARTYPVIDDVRYAVPGDRARWRADGSIELHGPRLRHDQLGRREDLRRGGRARRQGAPRCLRLRRRRAAERALGQRGGGDRPPAGGRGRHARFAACHRRRAHRPLQAAQGHRLRRRDRALPRRQGRLPLGAPDRRAAPSHP